MNNNGGSKIGCGTIIFIAIILMFLLFGGSSNNSSSTRRTTRTTQSNPIRDRDPEFYDYLEDRYNEMIKNH